MTLPVGQPPADRLAPASEAPYAPGVRVQRGMEF